MFLSLRALYKCSTVEPGIIPKIRSKAINYQRTYRVTYLDGDDRKSITKNLTPVQRFFSLKNFKLYNPDN